MRHLDLFSGIGGFAYAARETWGNEYENIGFCDKDYFCQQVLAKNFPGCTVHNDIKTLTNTDSQGLEGEHTKGAPGRPWTAEHVDLITGGFPCQPFSQAGKRRGTDDDRHLWPEMLRVIQEFQPSWVIGENVGGFVTWNDGMVFEQVCTDLEASGYEVQPFIIPASAVNAPHRRDRVWIVARYTEHDGRDGTENPQGNPKGEHRNPSRPDKIQQPKRANSVWHNAADAAKSIVRGLGLERQPDAQTTEPSSDRQPTSDTRRQRRQKGSRQDIQSKVQEAERPHFDISSWNRDWQEVAAATCYARVDDGLPRRVVRLPDGNTISEARWRKEAIKAYGNAIVPQVAMEIMKAIRDQPSPQT